MPAIDPVSLIYANALVSLVVTAALWMSRGGLRDACGGLHTWIVAELALAASRALSVIDLGTVNPVLPLGALVVPGAVAMLGMLLHIEALRRVVGGETALPVLAAQAVGLMLLFALPAAAMAQVGPRALWLHTLLAVMSLASLRWLWPLRGAWGGRLMAASALAGAGTFAWSVLADPRPTLAPVGVDLAVSLLLTTGLLFALQQRRRERLEGLVGTDALTGTLNRQSLMPLLERELSRAERHDRPLSVALFDLDVLKRVHDQHGHAMGDEVLAAFAARAQGLLRGGDLLGRWSDEEFLLVLPETGGDRAAQVAERIREGVAGSPLTPGAPAVTVSSGVASAHVPGGRTRDLTGLLERADRRLLVAKQGGNRVVATRW